MGHWQLPKGWWGKQQGWWEIPPTLCMVNNAPDSNTFKLHLASSSPVDSVCGFSCTRRSNTRLGLFTSVTAFNQRFRMRVRLGVSLAAFAYTSQQKAPLLRGSEINSQCMGCNDVTDLSRKAAARHVVRMLNPSPPPRDQHHHNIFANDPLHGIRM